MCENNTGGKKERIPEDIFNLNKKGEKWKAENRKDERNLGKISGSSTRKDWNNIFTLRQS